MQSLLVIAPPEIVPSLVKPFISLDLSSVSTDLYVLGGDESVGIEAIRLAIAYSQLPPSIGQEKVIFIKDGARMTHEAQNAFLKTLEEPSPYLKIIIATTDPGQILPTIHSRCLVLYGSSSPVISNHEVAKVIVDGLTNATISQKIIMAGLYGGNKIQALDTVKQLIRYYRQLLLTSKTKNHIDNINLLLKLHHRLEKNANPSLTLEHAFLSLK